MNAPHLHQLIDLLTLSGGRITIELPSQAQRRESLPEPILAATREWLGQNAHRFAELGDVDHAPNLLGWRREWAQRETWMALPTQFAASMMRLGIDPQAALEELDRAGWLVHGDPPNAQHLRRTFIGGPWRGKGGKRGRTVQAHWIVPIPPIQKPGNGLGGRPG